VFSKSCRSGGGGSQWLASQRTARSLFRLNRFGPATARFRTFHRPVELRSCIDSVYAEPVNLTDVEWTNTSGDTYYFILQAAPLWHLNGNLLGVSITFTDFSHSKRLQDELQPPTKNWKWLMKSYSLLMKSWRRPTRNCNPPTRNCRRGTTVD